MKSTSYQNHHCHTEQCEAKQATKKDKKIVQVLEIMEIEIAFMVLTNNSTFVINKIKQVIESNKYKATEKGTINIKDRYYDTPDKTLKRNNINLRIRCIDSKVPIITLKYQGEKNKDYSNRIEFEEEWSLSLYKTILMKIESTDMVFNRSKDHYREDAETTFQNLGLNKIMNKESKRAIINAIDFATNILEFGFAFDRVSINTKSHTNVCFCQLEIELKRKGNQTELRKFTTEILESSLFGRWSFNKLETGLAIIHLIDNNKMKKSVDYNEENFLTKAGVEKIESFLKNDIS